MVSKLMPFLKTAAVVLAILFVARTFLPENVKAYFRL